MYVTLPLGFSTPLDKCKARAATPLRNKITNHLDAPKKIVYDLPQDLKY
jgi:hypothetical protein